MSSPERPSPKSSSAGIKFPGQRALRIALRTAHIASIGWLLGAAIYQAPAEGPVLATMASGGAMVAEALMRYGTDWLRFVGSWVVLAKLGLLVFALGSGMALWPLLLALVLGSVISHAPGRVRQHALWGPDGACAGGARDSKS